MITSDFSNAVRVAILVFSAKRAHKRASFPLERPRSVDLDGDLDRLGTKLVCVCVCVCVCLPPALTVITCWLAQWAACLIQTSASSPMIRAVRTLCLVTCSASICHPPSPRAPCQPLLSRCCKCRITSSSRRQRRICMRPVGNRKVNRIRTRLQGGSAVSICPPLEVTIADPLLNSTREWVPPVLVLPPHHHPLPATAPAAALTALAALVSASSPPLVALLLHLLLDRPLVTTWFLPLLQCEQQGLHHQQQQHPLIVDRAAALAVLVLVALHRYHHPPPVHSVQAPHHHPPHPHRRMQAGHVMTLLQHPPSSSRLLD